MTTAEIAHELVSLCRAGHFAAATESLYSPDIVSVEAMAHPDGSREMKGIEAIKGKGAWWAENHEVHSIALQGPLVAGNHFAVQLTIDVTFKPTGRRHTMDELAVYHVANGKIVREEFFYGA